MADKKPKKQEVVTVYKDEEEAAFRAGKKDK